MERELSICAVHLVLFVIILLIQICAFTWTSHPIEIHQIESLSPRSQYVVDILDPNIEIYWIELNPSSYDIIWRGQDTQNIKTTMFPRGNIFENLTECLPRDTRLIDSIQKKKFIFLLGDSNERIALEEYSETLPYCDSYLVTTTVPQQFCCDTETLMICNIFTCGSTHNLTLNKWTWLHCKAPNSTVVDFKTRTMASIHAINEKYKIDLEYQCQMNEWFCMVMFEINLWDMRANNPNPEGNIFHHKSNMKNLYRYFKFNLSFFHRIVWRDAVQVVKWSDNYNRQISTFNRIGFNLFKANDQDLNIFKWSNFVPRSRTHDHHWDSQYNDLYLCLIFRYSAS
eukprot:40408_1